MNPQKGSAGGSNMWVSKFTQAFLVGLAVTSPLTAADSDASGEKSTATESHVEGGSHFIEFGDPIADIGDSFARLWREFGWLLVATLVFVLIKMILLRESLSEVVACILTVLAFLILHGVAVVRFAALEMRRLARALRSGKAHRSDRSLP
jgi:hypothetical protein